MTARRQAADFVVAFCDAADITDEGREAVLARLAGALAPYNEVAAGVLSFRAGDAGDYVGRDQRLQGCFHHLAGRFGSPLLATFGDLWATTSSGTRPRQSPSKHGRHYLVELAIAAATRDFDV